MNGTLQPAPSADTIHLDKQQGKIMKVTNLSTLEEHTYSDMDPLQAVCTSYCLDNNLSSWFFSMVHNKMRYIDTLPLCIGNKTISCGNWCIVK